MPRFLDHSELDTHTHTHTHVRTHTRIHTYVHTHRHTHTRTYASTHARARTHTHTHARAVGLFSTSDQLVADTATYTTHNNYKRRTSMPAVGYSNPQSQESSGRRTTPWTARQHSLYISIYLCILDLNNKVRDVLCTCLCCVITLNPLMNLK